MTAAALPRRELDAAAGWPRVTMALVEFRTGLTKTLIELVAIGPAAEPISLPRPAGEGHRLSHICDDGAMDVHKSGGPEAVASHLRRAQVPEAKYDKG
jgi:hypothetical protein